MPPYSFATTARGRSRLPGTRLCSLHVGGLPARKRSWAEERVERRGARRGRGGQLGVTPVALIQTFHKNCTLELALLSGAGRGCPKRWAPGGQGQSRGALPLWGGGRLWAQGLCPHSDRDGLTVPGGFPGPPATAQSSQPGPTSEPETRRPSTGTLVSPTAQGGPGWASAGSHELRLPTRAFQGPGPRRPPWEGDINYKL